MITRSSLLKQYSSCVVTLFYLLIYFLVFAAVALQHWSCSRAHRRIFTLCNLPFNGH